MMKTITLVPLILAALASPVLAQSNSLYMGAEAQFAAIKDRAQEDATAIVNSVGGSAAVVQDTRVYLGRVFGGLQINENIGLELGYMQSRNFGERFTGVTRAAVAYTGSVTMDVSGFDYSVLLRPSKSSGMNGLFLRLGAHNLTLAQNLTVNNNVAVASAKASGNGYLFGAGYDGEIMKDLDYRLTFTYLDKVAGLSNANASVVGFGIVKKF